MNKVKLIAVGDICINTKNGKDPFEMVKNIFIDKDILFGNLETVLSESGQEIQKAVLLHSKPDKVRYLKDAGFDVLNIANNHIMDLGSEGFNETLNVLNQNELLFVGAVNKKFKQHYCIMNKNGISFGFLGYYEYGGNFSDDIFLNKIDKDVIAADIEYLKEKCDIIVVSLHWGIENVFYPSPDQINLARNLIDAGANLILGHHSHVVQGIEKYKNGLIAYSLGNFQFFQTDRERTRNSICLSIEINKNGIDNYKIIPVKINESFVPCMMHDMEKQKTLSFIETISTPIVNERINEKWWFEEIAYEHLSGIMKAWVVRIKRYGVGHLYEFVRWLVSPFIIKCYLGLLRRKLGKHG